MPSLVNNSYEEFFTLPNGGKVQFFETKSLDSRKTCIHHPLIHFDTAPKGDWKLGYIVKNSNYFIIGTIYRLLKSLLRDLLFMQKFKWLILCGTIQDFGP